MREAAMNAVGSVSSFAGATCAAGTNTKTYEHEDVIYAYEHEDVMS
jgi:hypothetical protein